MKKLSKIISLSLTAAMLVCMPVMAAESPSRNSSSNVSVVQKDPLARAAEADALAAEASGIPMALTIMASSEKKTVGEYVNNAVAELPGLPNIVPVSQGGHVIINGAPSNQTFSVLKPADGTVSVAKTYASNIGGTVLNVIKVNASVGFNTATVNFYMPGVTATNNIKVVQLVNSQWNDVNVAEIRADHVVVDMTSLGTFAFIEIPAQ